MVYRIRSAHEGGDRRGLTAHVIFTERGEVQAGWGLRRHHRHRTRSAKLEAVELNLGVGRECEIREPGEQALHTDPHFLAAEPLAEAAVSAQRERGVATLSSLEIDRGRGVPV